MKNTLLLIIFLLLSLPCMSQKEAYVLYNAKGKKVSYKKMLKTLAKKDIVLFGEIHNNPISHWLQWEVTADLHKDHRLILGAEMLEADQQTLLDDYLIGRISAKELETNGRLWSNYQTDYAPLVNFAKEKQLAFIATNVPRRYARLVFKNGFEVLDSLPTQEKQWIAPLPIAFDSELPTYKNILSMMGDHGSPKLVMAQAIKDASMAHFILKHYKNDHVFIHYNGNYHSDHYEGILWYLKKENNALKYATISTVSQEDITVLLEKNKHLADFIICVDSDMTTTY